MNSAKKDKPIKIDDSYRITHPDQYNWVLKKSTPIDYSEQTMKSMENLGVEPSGKTEKEVVLGYYASFGDCLKGYVNSLAADLVNDKSWEISEFLKALEEALPLEKLKKILKDRNEE